MTPLPSREQNFESISAIILGAGQSQRMGQPKLLLPWGKRTIIEQILYTLRSAGIDNITVVLGPANQDLENLLTKLRVQIVYNPNFRNNQMISSLIAGVLSQKPSIEASLVVLGDQPGIEKNVVKMIIERYYQRSSMLVVPSFNNHRGHPWLIQMNLKEELLNSTQPITMREFLSRHAALIEYVEVNTPSILCDIDTPQDYISNKPPTSTQSE